MDDKKEKDGLAIVIASSPESDVGADFPKEFLGKNFDALEEGTEGTITVRYKVTDKGENGLSMDFTKLISCDHEGSEDSEDSDEPESMDAAFEKFSKEKPDKGEDGEHGEY